MVDEILGLDVHARMDDEMYGTRRNASTCLTEKQEEFRRSRNHGQTVMNKVRSLENKG